MSNGQDGSGDLTRRARRGQASLQDTGAARGQDLLAQALTRVARTLEGSGTPAATLDGIVGAAVALVPGVDEASISLVLGRRRIVSEAATGPLPRAVDQLQAETGEGPCVDAAYEQETVRVADMATEQRWPLFAARAAEAGARGMLSVQLFVSGDDLGALNLYSHAADAFDDESEHVGLMVASHAAIAYASVRRQAQLSEAVSSRLVIGQAQGMLMERYGLDDGQAFALLVRASRTTNDKLRVVARRLVDTRELPPSAAPSELT
ncbi:GAF and ANTAR domain-containing protein [Aquipuribacter hungaricus]|uniref:GAF and ANTAR domain-containing protein n=1 Tax=Aquipuribacter hungaricus TaxID=545624 RepID=A0ABV7WDZ5_9MICO